MKPNEIYEWQIELCAEVTANGPMHRPNLSRVTGDIEDAPEAANVAESNVEWEVSQFIITRMRRIGAAP